MQTRIQVRLLRVFIPVARSVILLTILNAGCNCIDLVQLHRSLSSPDGRHIVDEYTVSGGGAAGWSTTRIIVRRADEDFHSAGDYLFEGFIDPPLDIKWRDNTTVTIGYPSNFEVTKTVKNWNDIKLEYVPSGQKPK